MFNENTFADKKKARLFLFFITCCLLVLFFPQGGKFKYEYQKGKPWMHEVLVAPFDFPVYKSEANLIQEKDSIVKNYTPYFNLNSKIGVEQRNKFRQMYANYWNYYNRRYPGILNADYKQALEQKTSSLLEFVYKNGIVELPDELLLLSRQSGEISIVHDNIADEVEIDEVFSPKRAYEYIVHELDKYSDQLALSSKFNPDAFFKGFRIETYITPNLFYDEIASKRVKEDALKSVSLTEGMILTGERIIFTGDMITNHSFKLLESLKKEYEQRMGLSSNYVFVILGQAILVFVLMLFLFVFIIKYRKEIGQSTSHLAFVLFIILLFALLTSLTIKFKPFALYVIPFAVIPILVRTFFDSKLALFVHVITVVLVAFWVPNSFEFAFLNISAGIVALLSLTNLYRRNKMFVTSGWIMFVYVTLYIGLSLYQEGSLQNLNADNLLYFFGNGLLVLSSIPLIYMFEKLFGFLSDATLLELSDSNQPLLRKLAEIAPGTFQHSLQVANLSEEAIFKIGGNPLLVRAGALYHDIGKMENPMFFIENLSDQNNPHENLEYENSAEIILRHVTKGVELAQQYKLPVPIIDFIRTHHGTSTVHYFYRSYLKKYPGTVVDIKRFSYPGPKPFSKEMAVVMMADGIEAASRSIKTYTEKDLSNMVDTIINSLLKDGQFNDSDISIKDIETVREIFKKRMRTIYHIRIEYPQLESATINQLPATSKE